MRRYHHLTEGILQPDEFNQLQKVFDTIIAEPWFDLDEANREAFAAEVIKNYRRGLVDFEKLHKLCRLIAVAHYSRDLPDS